MSGFAVGSYCGYVYKFQRICDMLAVKTKSRWWFLYLDGKPTGDYFKTLRELKDHVDSLRHEDAISCLR